MSKRSLRGLVGILVNCAIVAAAAWLHSFPESAEVVEQVVVMSMTLIVIMPILYFFIGELEGYQMYDVQPRFIRVSARAASVLEKVLYMMLMWFVDALFVALICDWVNCH